MASKSLPISFQHPRYHSTCDRCGVDVGYSPGNPMHRCTAHRETAAGMFTYVFCAACSMSVEKKRPITREREYRKAMIRHAAKYSQDFARFIAHWYGIRAGKILEG
jgi:hypothetical protein